MTSHTWVWMKIERTSMCVSACHFCCFPFPSTTSPFPPEKQLSSSCYELLFIYLLFMFLLFLCTSVCILNCAVGCGRIVGASFFPSFSCHHLFVIVWVPVSRLGCTFSTASLPSPTTLSSQPATSPSLRFVGGMSCVYACLIFCLSYFLASPSHRPLLPFSLSRLKNQKIFAFSLLLFSFLVRPDLIALVCWFLLLNIITITTNTAVISTHSSCSGSLPPWSLH